MTISTDRTVALTTTNDLGQAGAVFNDSTRLLDGGLWATPDSNNQTPYLGQYQGDVTAVSADVAQVLGSHAATVNGATYALSATDTATLTKVQGELQTLLSEAPLSVGHDAAATHAQGVIHATQMEILGQVQNDPALTAALNAASYATGTGANNVGFQTPSAGSDSAGALHDATAGTSLAAVGNVYDAAVHAALGGINSSNVGQINTDLHAVESGVNSILHNPTQLAQIEAGEAPQDAALTTIHLQTVANQVNLQLQYDGQSASGHSNEPTARANNDNLLDIIDIVQNDANLNTAAGGNGNPGTAGGFSEQPAYLNGPGGVNAHGGTVDVYQDNAAQTAFWSQFIAGANQINNGLTAVAGGNTAGIAALQTQIQQYTQLSQGFDKSQGGVFGARFDNELLSGTEKTDAANATAALQDIAAHGITTANAAQALAAGSGFVADANDVSGNNVPVGGLGTSYVGTSTTVAGATAPAGLGTGSLTSGANGASSTVASAAGAGSSGAGSSGATHSGATSGATDGHGGTADTSHLAHDVASAVHAATGAIQAVEQHVHLWG